MTNPIPSIIYQQIKTWIEQKKTCQINLHVNGDGKITIADRIIKERVTSV
jgi:hypothetical protein